MSSGQRTLVGIVKATLHEPSLLVLDEPTASLDPDIALRVRTALLGYCESTGAALLVTSHDMREVEMLTERVMFLARGEVVANDTPAIVASTVRTRQPRGRLPRPSQRRTDDEPASHPRS